VITDRDKTGSVDGVRRVHPAERRHNHRHEEFVRDYETRLAVSESMIQVAMGSLLLRRIAH
jgi:hypothetical protein